MLIQCTKKLLEELKIKPKEVEAAPEPREPLFCWHANLIRLNRRKTVVLVNDSNKYVVVLFGLRAPHFQALGDHIVHGIREAFREECVAEEIIEQFIQKSMPHPGQMTYTKTKNRSLVARLNHACENAYYLAYVDLLDEGSVYQPVLSKEASERPVSAGPDQYVYPNQELFKDLETMAGEPVVRVRSAVLRVTLDLENQQVWRRLVVPLNMALERFHLVLQRAFGWRNSHLHEFYVFSDEKSSMWGHDSFINHPAYNPEGFEPLVNLVFTKDDFEYEDNIPIRLEKGIRLSDYLPAYTRMKYIYDFGDNWQHYIEVEEVLEDYDKNYAVCLEGQGNAPPEDVGGSSGFEEFLEIISNENHPDHEDMVNWGSWQGYQDFDLQQLNHRLRHV